MPLIPFQANETSDDDSDDAFDSDSDDSHTPSDGMLFSCRYQTVLLFTHAPADHLLYNLGMRVFTGPPDKATLKDFATTRWKALARAQKKVAAEKAKAAVAAKATAKSKQKGGGGASKAKAK